MSRARPPKTRRCRPTRAANFRSRPIWPTACAASSPTASLARACPTRCANGSRSRNGARWCRAQRELLVETFPRADKHYLVCYPFEGRLAHQTLGMLLTRRLERARLRRSASSPTNTRSRSGASATSRRGIARGELSLDALFDEDMLGDDLEAWLAESALMKRTLPQLRDHRRPDRAALSGQGKVAAPGHDLDRPRLRRAAPPPARSHPAARRPRRRRDRPPRHRAGSAKCSRASRGESSIKRSTTSRRWRCR